MKEFDYSMQDGSKTKGMKRQFVAALIVSLLIGAGIGIGIGYAAFRGSDNSTPASQQQTSNPGDGDPSISKKILDEIQPLNIRRYLRNLTAKPHLAGTPSDKLQGEELVAFWRDLGLETRTHKYNILLSYPNETVPNVVQVLNASGEVVFKSALAEKILTNEHNQSDVVPPFNAFSASGTPETNKLVYVNYGRAEDFEWLIEQNVTLNGTMAIARYGKVFRGDKVKFAEQWGCVGMILYSDPADYSIGVDVPTYPNTTWLPKTGVQRGSVLMENGDPLTPGYPSINSAFRLLEKDADLPGIPSQPISYGDAQQILKHLGGDEAPSSWRGGLNMTYRIGPGLNNTQWKVRMRVSMFTDRRDVYNVMAVIPGKIEPDRYVLLGNHRDAWVFGAVDPSSATATLMELSRVMAKLVKDGWQPRRSIAFVSWSAEEYGLMGSLEWVEHFSRILGSRTIAYLNVDIALTGNASLSVSATPTMKQVIYDAAKKVPNPNPDEVSAGRKTVYDTWLYGIPDKYNSDEPAIFTMGSGSDYTGFLQTIGIACSDIRYSFNRTKYRISSYPMYHSAYETFYLVDSLMDRGFKYHAAVAGVWAEVARALADEQVLPLDVTRYSEAIALFVDDVENRHGAKLNSSGLAGDLENLRQASHRLAESTTDFAKRLSKLDKKDVLAVRRANDQIMQLDRAFIDPLGLPGRPLIRNVIFAPSSKNSYAGDSFPGLEDTLYGIDQLSGEAAMKQWRLVEKEIARLVFVIQAAAATLDDATAFSGSF